MRNKVFIFTLALIALIAAGCSSTNSHGGYTASAQVPVDDGLFHMRQCAPQR